MYVSASNNPLSTLTLVHTWYEESTPQDTKRSSHPSNNKTRLPYKHVVDRFISNDPEYTNLGTLKLITVLNQSIMISHGLHTISRLLCWLNILDVSLYSIIWDFLFSQISIWTTITWSNVWVVLPKPSWYEFLIGFLMIWTPASKYLHLITFSK